MEDDKKNQNRRQPKHTTWKTTKKIKMKDGRPKKKWKTKKFKLEDNKIFKIEDDQKIQNRR